MLETPEPPAALAAAMAALVEDASPEVLAVLAEHAESGWPQAQRALGLAYARGSAVPQDFEKALELFRQAADRGDADALYYIGYAYLSGSGVVMNETEALGWFIVAATHGQPEALAERDRALAELRPEDRQSAFFRSRALARYMAAGWSRDPASGTAVWLPSWFRTGSYALKIEVPAKDGYADGDGRIELKASLPGDSDRVFEGRFAAGYYFGKGEPRGGLHFLKTDDFMLRLPASREPTYRDVAFWLRVDFGVDFAADPCYVATNRRPDLVAAVPESFPARDDDSVKSLMGELWLVYLETCPAASHAAVSLVPNAFRRERDRFGHLVFGPQLATAYLSGGRGEELTVSQFENHVRRTYEARQRELETERLREARETARRRAEQAAPGRGNPDVRGLRLGMTLPEVREHFADEIAGWDPPWKPERALPPYAQFKQKIRFSDGARIEASFTSPVSGSLLFAIVYEQDLRDGPAPRELAERLVAKYGEPDGRGNGGVWWSYDLVSRVNEGMGAFMKVHFRIDGESGRVEYFRLIINDAGFGSHDERAAYAAKREAEYRAYEAGKSDEVKF